MQVLPPPPRCLKRDPIHCTQIMHMRPNSIEHDFLCALDRIGGPSFTSVRGLSHATLFRVAYSTLDWQHVYNMLHMYMHKNINEIDMPWCAFLEGGLRTLPWDTPPLVATLHEAFLGFPSNPSLHAALSPPLSIAWEDLASKLWQSDIYARCLPSFPRVIDHYNIFTYHFSLYRYRRRRLA